MELFSAHGLCWIFWIYMAICATGARSCIVTAPNVVRLGAEETAVVFNQGPPREVTLTLQDHPARIHTLFRDTISLGTGESRLVRMPIDPQKLSADEIRSGQRRYVSLVVECYALYKKEARLLISDKSGYLLLQSDKPIYTPKQTVHFRMVAVGEDLVPSIGELKLEIKNPQNIVTYQTVLSAKDNASATGMFSHSYAFPESPILGQWKAVVTYGSYFTQQTEITFEVQEYVLPTFSVTLTTPSVILTEQEFVEGKVEAKYVYGKPVEGSANFRFKIRNEGGTDRELGSTDFKELVHGEAMFRIATSQFKMPQRKRWAALVQGNRLVVEAEVLDKATSKRVTAVDESAVFATSPYLVGFRHTPKDFKPGTVTVIVADVTTLTGKPAVGIPCAITVLDDHELDVHVEPTISVTDALGRAAFLVQSERHHSTIKAKVQTRDLQYKPHQQSEGNIAVQAFNSPVDAFVALNRMDTRKSFKVGEYFDIHVITEPADISPIFYLVTHRGQTKQHGVLQVGGSLSNRSVHFAVTRDMSPRIRVLVYAFHRGHLLADSLTVQVEEVCTESSTISIEPNFANDEPGNNGSLKILGKSGTRVGILGVDKAVYILNNKGLLTREKLFMTLKSHELGCGPGGGLSSEEVMSNFGVVIISEEGTENVLRTEGSCEARVRHRRSVRQRAQRKFDHDPLLKECCALGQKRDRVGRRCTTRAHIVRHYVEGTKGERCAKAFEECCLNATSFPEGSPSREDGQTANAPDEPDRSKSAVEFTVDEIDEVDGEVSPDTVIRRDFRETWLFDEQVIGPDGVADFVVSLPHSITTWSVQAVSVSPTGGVCVPQPQEVRVFQPIFLQVALPYKVVRNEQIEVLVTVYNYGAESLRGNVYIYGVEGLCTGALPGDRSERRPVVVEANSASSVTFPVVPLKEGLFVIKIHVRSSRGEDVVEKELNVVPEGVTVEKSISVPIDPANVRRRRTRSVRGELFQDSLDPGANLQVISVNTRLPPDAIPDTKTCSLSVIGNQIGPSVQTTLENIEDLVTMPTGCGEQNMMLMAPTLYAMEYLKQNNMVDEALEEKGYRYIREGYQRELSFRKMDGSFSAFKHRKSSVWLTAFVLRIFCKARRYASIDPTVIEKGMLWLSAAQKLDGSFVEKKPIMHKTMLGGVRGAIPMTAFVLLTFNECMRPPSGVAYDKYDIYSRDSKRMSRRSVSDTPGSLFSELGFPGLSIMSDVEDLPDMDTSDDNIWPEWMNSFEDNSTDPVVDEADRESQTYFQILGNSAEMAVNYLREHAFESDEPYVAALVAYALSQSNSSEKHAALSALKDRLIYDPMLSTRSTGTEPSALVVEGTAYALLTLLAHNEVETAKTIVNWLNTHRSASGSFASTQDTVVALQALTEFALKSREPNVDLTCNVTLSSQRNFQRSLRLKRDNAAILQQLDIRDVKGKMFVKASGTGSGLLSVKLKYNVLVPPELLCKFNITVRADIRNTRENNAKSYELPPDLLKDLLGDFRRRRSIASWFQSWRRKKPATPSPYRHEPLPLRFLHDSRSRDYSPASPFFPEETGGFNSANGDTSAASVQATPQSKLTYNIEVCSRYIGTEDSNMAVIEVGLFSGFEPIKDDLEKATNDSDLLAKYEMTEKNVILYFDKIPWESPTCVMFRIQRQHVVYNVQSAVVKVYDYYNPMHSCTQFYGPGSTSPLLKLVCEGNQCECAAAQCPRKEPFLDVERAGTTLKKRDKLRELVCQQHDFAWIGVVFSNNVINGYRHITFRVDTVIKEGLEPSNSAMTGTKLFVARELCSTADLIKGARYFVFGRDSEPFEKDGETIMKYNLDKDVRVFNTDERSSSVRSKKLYSVLQWLTSGFERQGGCHA
ncbi:complement C3 isoform X1 [Rhipicephalus microplus]|uniref:complement C3 isoform X1 n=1 Tax=Rhipicephalus microplus TaxID=6941 RepID=UPI003F6D661D